MEYVTLGSTRLALSRIGFGCAVIGSYDYGPADDRQSIAAIHAAFDRGVTLFDTADVYGFGHAERVLGEALAQHPDALVATKVGVRWDELANTGKTTRDLSPGYIVQAVDASLRRLRRETIDLYQMHWPDPATPLEETVAALLRCQDEGKVRYLGLCNVGIQAVRQMQTMARFESIQLPFSLAQPGLADAMQVCAEEFQMTTVAYSVLAHGFFAGKLNTGRRLDNTDLRRRTPLLRGPQLERNRQILAELTAIGARNGAPPAQVALRWALDHPSVAVVLAGTRNPEQARDNVAAAGWCLSREDFSALNSLVHRDLPTLAEPNA